MIFFHEQSHNKKRLLYQFLERDIFETMSLGQITNNSIDGLIPATYISESMSIAYDITQMIPLEEFFQKPINKEQLLKILSGIVTAVASAQNYMIEPQFLLFDKKYTYIHSETMDIRLICLPIIHDAPSSMNLQTYLWNLVGAATKDKSENREYVSDLMEKLNADPLAEPDRLAQILNEFSQTKEVPTPKAHLVNQDQESSDAEQLPIPEKSAPGFWSRLRKRSMHADKQKKTKNKTDASDAKESVPESPKDNEMKRKNLPCCENPENNLTMIDLDSRNHSSGQTADPFATILEPANSNRIMEPKIEGDETVLDMWGNSNVSTAGKKPYLLREKGNEIILINGSTFQVGSDYDYTDYHISDNKTVDDIHARIIKQGQDYFIKDVSSHNKTFVDDNMIAGMAEIKLHHGTRIRLGTERFVFYLY